MTKHICYYMRENIMILATQSARATMLVFFDDAGCPQAGQVGTSLARYV